MRLPVQRPESRCFPFDLPADGMAGEWKPSKNRYQQPPISSSTGNDHVWEDRDIAYLKHSDQFSDEDKKALLEPERGNKHGYLPAKATGHPVIILRRISNKSTHVLITAISSYSACEGNNFLPPWKQEHHRWKKPKDFRALEGSELPLDSQRWVYLEKGERMPKNGGHTSWIRYVLSPSTLSQSFSRRPFSDRPS